ncbi:putative uncharacterized protein [Erysipelotrichaceae bacterium CAG:64]|nr:putative uncharacterized protein [Erysipelotrichaceae bacterium CAG:64]
MAFVWEQRKFVEFVKNAAKKNKDNIDLEPYAVTNDRGFIAQKDAHDDFGYMSNVDRTAYNIVPPNSFAYNPARINVGSLGYYEGTENVIVSSLYEVFQTEEYIDDKFLLHWFKSDSFPRWIEKLQEGSVRLYFYFDKLVQCQMMVPSLEEQKRISAYLDSIDQLITLHQRKRMLRRCFFSIDWEQRKVSEIADRFDNLRVPVAANLRTPGTTPYYGANGIQDYVEGYTHDGEFVLVAEDGANDLKNYPVKCVNGRIWVNNHAHVLQARPQIASNQFLAYSMSQANIEALLVGGGRAKLNAEVMMGIVLRIPRLQEQEVIGGYFYKLDQLITLHQCKSNFCKKNEVNAWEQRKLGEVAKYRNGKAHENCIDDDGKYIVVNSKFVSTNGKVKKFSNMQNEPLFENEVAFVLSDVPNGRAIARTFLVEKSDKYTLNQRIAGITPLNETDPYYLHVLMNRHPYFLAFDDGVKQTNLSVSDVMKFESYYPKYEEQETIGRCFSQLDQLITLHQWECNINENTEGNDEKQRKPIKKLIISEGNLSLVDDMFLLHRMTFLVCNKYILLRLNVVKYKITIIIISNILYSIVSLLIIACYLIVINKQLIILIYVEISVVIIKGDDDYARIRS